MCPPEYDEAASGGTDAPEVDDQLTDEARRLGSRIERAVRDWTAQLQDLTGRNNLLNFKVTKRGGSIVFDGDHINQVELARLLGGFRTDLSKLILDFDARDRAVRSARSALKTATANYEERGLTTLYLAWGMATWANRVEPAGRPRPGGVTEASSADSENTKDEEKLRRPWTPNAPVLLQELVLEPKGRAAEDFELELNGEWEVNPTLLQQLAEMGLGLDGESLVAQLGENDERPRAQDLFDFITKVADEAELAGFSITSLVVLGNFSYAKLPMVRDLAASLSNDLLVQSEIICAIAGDDTARQVIRDRHPEVSYDDVDRTAPEDEFLICDADSSQNLAINTAIKGGDLVIQGPPGTGKSQTIANLIATLSARGKRVLFVAEKRAAIDVVIERLRKVGLAELVLDLHGGVKSRIQVLQELNKAMTDASATPAVDTSSEDRQLVARREVLVERTAALHEHRSPWGLSVFDIQVALLDLPDRVHTKRRFDREVLEQLSASVFEAGCEDLRDFIGAGGFAIVNDSNPWLGAFAKATVTTSDRAQQVLDDLVRFSGRTLPTTTARISQILTEVGLRQPVSVSDWAGALGLLERTRAILEYFDRRVFELDLQELLAALAPLSRGRLSRPWRATTDKAFRRARKEVKALVLEGRSVSSRDLYAAVSDATGLREVWKAASNIDSGLPQLPLDVTGAEGIYNQFLAELRALEAVLDTADFESLGLSELGNHLEELLKTRNTLATLPELHVLRTRLTEHHLWPIVDEARQRDLDVDDAISCLRYCWLSSILSALGISDKRIGVFDGQQHSRTVREFTAADRAHQTATPYRIRRLLAERIVRTREQFPPQSDLLRKQAALKRKVKPIRELYGQAPELLSVLKPCWAMSPLAVSQLLPLRKCFDVVIFDEASQVAPADAVGALMRAGRCIVAGDSKQLPPTRFFASGESGVEEEEDVEEEEIDLSVTTGIDSILEVMCTVLPPPKGQQTLRWHYRSKDERLIAFSNSQELLYDWSLVTFPGVSDEQVITHHLVPFVPSANRPKAATLPAEVQRVVELVKTHASEHPDRSLGVIALGSPHADAIEEELRVARKEDDALNEFLDAVVGENSEQFFVKNLERVQGDERDAIILTIGYGRAPDGRMRYTFGPLNAAGGERRLNVAVTRARRSMTLVSSFSAQEMDPSSLRSDGARLLRDYVAFAESGGSDLGHRQRISEPLNPFERDVERHLTGKGIQLIAQFGCSGYWIDFVARHPTLPGRYVLAIETDGARYHSAPTARDRDRLRQEHLERLGWTFHRIWSTDWFYHREEEIDRAYRAYQLAVASSEERPAVLPPHRRDSDPEPSAFKPPTPSRQGSKPVYGYRGKIDAYSDQELVNLIKWIESDTLMRTEEELLDEAIRELGFQRRGPKIVERLKLAIYRSRNGVAVPPPPPPKPRTYKRRSTSYRGYRRRY